MDIRVLRYFLTVVKEQSISRAAEVLHMTQPPLSRQIADLERELGKELFVRGGRRLSLTQQGRILKKYAEEIIALSERAAKEVKAFDNELTGEIRIAAGESVQFRFLAEAATRFRKEHPGVSFSLYSGNYEDIVDKLDSGFADFGLLIGASDLDKYNYIRLPCKDRWGLLIRRDDPLAGREYVGPEDILELPLMMSRQATENREFLGWLKGYADKLNVAATYNLLFNAAIMAEAGFGGVLCLEGLSPQYEGNKMVFVPLQPELETAVALVWNKHHEHSKTASAFLDTLRNGLK